MGGSFTRIGLYFCGICVVAWGMVGIYKKKMIVPILRSGPYHTLKGKSARTVGIILISIGLIAFSLASTISY